MSFSKLRKSRLTMMVLATAWLPYMMVCCVVSPFENASGAEPNCHILAGLAPASAEASTHSHSGDHSAHHEAGSHHDDSKSSHDGQTPAHSCCELTGKTNVTLEKGVEFTAQPALVVVAVLFSELSFPDHVSTSSARVDLHEHSPPIYLKNASFLI